MACAQTYAGLAKDCEPNIGGIKAAWITNHADVASVTVTANKISAIAMANEAKFKKYHFRPGTSNYESTANISEENGPQDVTTLINLVFGRMETTKRLEVEAMRLGEMALIVKDMNDILWYFGKDNPVVAASGTAGATGTARSDRNGYTVALQDTSKTFPFEIDAAALTTEIVDEL